MAGYEAKHWTIIAIVLGAIAVQIGGLNTWNEALTPSFISGALLSLVAAIGAIHTDKPLTARQRELQTLIKRYNKQGHQGKLGE